MPKRVSLKERRANDANDVKGIDVIFQTPSPQTAGPTTVGPQNATLAAGASETPPQAEPVKPVLAKVTIYVRPDQVVAIEAIQLAQRQSTGQKPDKSDLIQEALDLLIEKYRLP